MATKLRSGLYTVKRGKQLDRVTIKVCKQSWFKEAIMRHPSDKDIEHIVLLQREQTNSSVVAEQPGVQHMEKNLAMAKIHLQSKPQYYLVNQIVSDSNFFLKLNGQRGDYARRVFEVI